MSNKLTVLMSVYNGLPYLQGAVDSILGQSFSEFEFLIIDDCSDDGSGELLEIIAKNDTRIRLIKNDVRLGLGVNLAEGVRLAKTDFVARMDADDIAVVDRLEKQVQFLQDNSEVDILGSWAVDIDDSGDEIGLRKMPLKHEDIVKFIWACPLIHPTVMFRVDSVVKAGSYGNERRRQDYALWFRCVHAGLVFANIGEPLLKYRYEDSYFKKNNFSALLSQVKIGWQGCILVGAGFMGYVGVVVPLLKGVLPMFIRKWVSSVLKYVDPRNRG